MAEVVVTGKVKSIKATGERETQIDGHDVSLRIMEATINAFHATKGEIPTTFVLRYPQLELDGIHGVTDPPGLIGLKEGERYRFYLKKKGEIYFGALDGTMDQGYAAMRLLPQEMASGSPLLKKDAHEIAEAYFSKFRPKAKIEYVEARSPSPEDPRWHFTFYAQSPSPIYPKLTSDGEISVDGAESVTKDSWVGLEEPRPGNDISAEDVGKTVRLTVAEMFGSPLVVLQGKIGRLGRKHMVGEFFSPFSGKEKPQTMEFPRKSLVSVQRILPYTATKLRTVPEVGASLRFPVGWQHEEKDKFGYVMKPFGEARQKVRIHLTGYKGCTPAEAARRGAESVAKRFADRKLPPEELRSTTPIVTKSGLKGVKIAVANEKSTSAPYLYRCYFRNLQGAIFCVCLYSFGDEAFAKQGEEIIIDSLKVLKE